MRVTSIVLRYGGYLYSDENDYHPLQPEAVLLTQVVPHQVGQLCAVLQLLVHHLEHTNKQRHSTTTYYVFIYQRPFSKS